LGDGQKIGSALSYYKAAARTAGKRDVVPSYMGLDATERAEETNPEDSGQ